MVPAKGVNLHAIPQRVAYDLQGSACLSFGLGTSLLFPNLTLYRKLHILDDVQIRGCSARFSVFQARPSLASCHVSHCYE